MTVTLGTDMSLTPQATAQWADQRNKTGGFPKRDQGFESFSLQQAQQGV